MLENLDKQYLLQTYAKEFINFKRGNNAVLFDEKGDDFIDFSSGIGVTSVGHGNEKLAQAIYNQAKNLIHTSNLYSIEPQALLAEKIANLSGYKVATFFGNSGAEANEGAIKIARKYGRKNFKETKFKVLTLENSFHGRTITTIKATGQEKFHNPNFSPYPDGFSYDSKIEDIYNSIDEQTVAVMIELVQGEGGVQPFDKEAVQKLENFLKQNNILFIVDEVQTGVYRTGEFLCSNLYEINPDIITLAKGLAGGVPIGAVLTKHKDIFEFGDHGSTFGGNYLSSSAALCVLEILEELKKSGKLDQTIKYFETKLNTFYQNHLNLFLEHVGVGLMRGLRVKDEETLANIIKSSIKNRILVLKAGKNTLRFLPCLTINKEEIDTGFQRLEKAVNEIK